MGPGGRKFRNNFRGRTGHLLHGPSANPGEIDGVAAEYYDALVPVGPGWESENDLESLAANHKRINVCQELVVAVGFAAVRRQKVELAVRPRDEAVNAGADKHRDRHGGFLAVANNPNAVAISSIKFRWGAGESATGIPSAFLPRCGSSRASTT